jgi:hypothetical protein
LTIRADYLGNLAVSTLTYLYQGRVQYQLGRRFDAALELRQILQPSTNTSKSSSGTELGYWLTQDLRLGLGYSFKPSQGMSESFLTNPVKKGSYFAITTKLSSLFDLFGTSSSGLVKGTGTNP